MDYLPLVPLFVVVYVITVDRNVADLLYLKVVKVPMVWLATTALRYKLLLQLKYDTYRIKRGHIPRRFMDMAREIREGGDD